MSRGAIGWWLWRALRVAVLVYVGLLVLLAVLQRRLIYLRMQAREVPLVARAAEVGLEPWRDADGVIVGWKGSGSGRAPNRILVFHGNAGYAAHRGHFVRGLGSRWEVYLCEYPGYGARPGEPSETSIKEAADAALAQLLAEDDRPVHVAGESLGSGAACFLAGTHPEAVHGVLLITPFTALTDVAASHYPFLPVRWLMADRFDNVSSLRGFRGPVAVLLAGSDEVVPVGLGQRLFDGYPGPKRLWVQDGAGHNEIDLHPSAEWWRESTNFLLSR